MPDFISQYLIANSGTEVPERYHKWAAIALLGGAIGRRAWVDHGHFRIFPWLYYCFIGGSGSGKTTAMDIAHDMFVECFPDFPLGGNIASREQIIQFMASDKCSRFFKDEKGEPVEWKPYALFVNELSNFVSFNPGPMVGFLTDMFDRPYYKSNTLARDLEYIDKPYLFIIACATPEYIMETFKATLISGGAGRRILLIYDTCLDCPIITFPAKSQEAMVAEEWCKNHLRQIPDQPARPFTWTDEARQWMIHWNTTRERPKGEILAGYHKSKDMIVQKVAMCLAYAIPGLKPIFTEPLIMAAIKIVESNEENLERLVLAAGANRLALPRQKLLNLLEAAGGYMQEKLWHLEACKDMQEREYNETKLLLMETEQIAIRPIEGIRSVMFKSLSDAYDAQEKAKKEAATISASPPPQPKLLS